MDPKVVESNLGRIFELAASWQAILLMWVPPEIGSWLMLNSLEIVMKPMSSCKVGPEVNSALMGML